MKKGAEQRQSTPRTGQAPWHTVVWITAVTVIFSISTMTLAAFAQTPTTGYANNISGILQSLRALRKEVKDVGIRIIQIEGRMVDKGLIPPVATNTNNNLAQNPNASNPGPSRTEESTNPPATQTPAPPSTTPPTSEPIQPTPTPPTPPPPAPPAGPQNPEKHKICLQQCNDAFNACIEQTKIRPLHNNYGGDDPFCTWNRDKECIPLCDGWYNSPVVIKPPVPPIESKAQACLIDCRTNLSKCMQEVDVKYKVTAWQPGPPPPQAYFNELSACMIQKDNACRAVCPAINPNATAPTQ